MSWSYGAIHEQGLILKENEFVDLLKLNKNYLEENDLTEEDFDGDLQDIAYDFGIYPVFATVCDLDKLVGFNSIGEGQYDLRETIEDDTIYVLWLRKDNLLNCYKDYDEIVREIENSICEKFEVDIETVYEKFGKTFITDRLGLATGFYSDR